MASRREPVEIYSCETKLSFILEGPDLLAALRNLNRHYTGGYYPKSNEIAALQRERVSLAELSVKIATSRRIPVKARVFSDGSIQFELI